MLVLIVIWRWGKRERKFGYVMGHIDSIGSDCDIDLESGGNTSEEDGSKDLSLRSDHAMYLLNRTWSGSEGFNGAARCGDGLSFYDEVLSSGQISAENVTMSSEELGEEMVNFLQKKWAKEKRRKLNSEKPPKPPRPPGGPSLDAADMKLVKEISELTMMKRQRTARMKALKKVKAEKKKSSLSNVFAMAVTVLFCLVIIFQVRRDGGIVEGILLTEQAYKGFDSYGLEIYAHYKETMSLLGSRA